MRLTCIYVSVEHLTTKLSHALVITGMCGCRLVCALMNRQLKLKPLASYYVEKMSVTYLLRDDWGAYSVTVPSVVWQYHLTTLCVNEKFSLNVENAILKCTRRIRRIAEDCLWNMKYLRNENDNLHAIVIRFPTLLNIQFSILYKIVSNNEAYTILVILYFW